MNGIRRFPRYSCPGGVEIKVAETNRRLWGRLGDICRAGLYMEVPEPWPLGTAIEVRLEIAETYIEGAGTVVTSHPGVGMGIALDVNPPYVEDIEKILAGLAANAEGTGTSVPYR